MSSLLGLLAALPPLLILLCAAALPALEASALVGLVIPGETAVFVAGVTAHGGQLPLWAVVSAAAVGAVAGDQIGYLLGRRWGPGLLQRLPRRVRDHPGLDAAMATVSRRGGWAVLLGRWTAVLRALVPGLAGSAGMSRRVFTVCNIVGGLTWAAVVAGLGYGAGAAYLQIEQSLGHVTWVGLAAVGAAGIGTKLLRRHRGNRRDREIVSR